jgi:hypothetical protein
MGGSARKLPSSATSMHSDSRENTTVVSDDRPVGQHVWTSCCFQLDKSFLIFLVQTVLGLLILTFCAWQLIVVEDCARATPYWGLVGTITGFFFNNMMSFKK